MRNKKSSLLHLLDQPPAVARGWNWTPDILYIEDTDECHVQYNDASLQLPDFGLNQSSCSPCKGKFKVGMENPAQRANQVCCSAQVLTQCQGLTLSLWWWVVAILDICSEVFITSDCIITHLFPGCLTVVMLSTYIIKTSSWLILSALAFVLRGGLQVSCCWLYVPVYNSSWLTSPLTNNPAFADYPCGFDPGLVDLTWRLHNQKRTVQLPQQWGDKMSESKIFTPLCCNQSESGRFLRIWIVIVQGKCTIASAFMLW